MTGSGRFSLTRHPEERRVYCSKFELVGNVLMVVIVVVVVCFALSGC